MTEPLVEDGGLELEDIEDDSEDTESSNRWRIDEGRFGSIALPDFSNFFGAFSTGLNFTEFSFLALNFVFLWLLLFLLKDFSRWDCFKIVLLSSLGSLISLILVMNMLREKIERQKKRNKERKKERDKEGEEMR